MQPNVTRTNELVRYRSRLILNCLYLRCGDFQVDEEEPKRNRAVGEGGQRDREMRATSALPAPQSYTTAPPPLTLSSTVAARTRHRWVRQ